MLENFSLPQGAIGRFAIVKLWPDIKTAEDECIARIKIAALALGLECVEIHANGVLISDPAVIVSKANVDFVIHLHYDTPKNYDAYSFVALWNPLKFYHEWGYVRTSRNLTTHDDFLSCSSDAADDHVARMVRNTFTHLSARFNLYHSTADVSHPPSLGDGKLFYAGINWEAISGGKSRHQELLKQLDKTGLFRIYGPSIFQGVKVWAGYKSYVKEIPFDGISMIDEISKAGIALVLSSQAHKDSKLMSSRLFESVSAGALVICDENPFAKKFFGDSLLYIDSRSPVNQILADITGHLKWVSAHPDQVLAMISKSQEIFREKFTLIRSLVDLYGGLADRKSELLERQNPHAIPSPKVRLHFLMLNYDEMVLRTHIQSVNVQEYTHFSPTLVVDSYSAYAYRDEIAAALADSPVTIELIEVDYFTYSIYPEIKEKRSMGSLLLHLLGACEGFDAFMFVAPNEQLFSNHLAVLAGALQRNSEVNCAATAAVLLNGGAPVHDVHEYIDFGHVNRFGPTGYGRFIFRISAIPEDISIALPYLDGSPFAILVGDNPVDQQMPASIRIFIDHDFVGHTFDAVAENEIIRDYSPNAFKISTGFVPRFDQASLHALEVSKTPSVLRFLTKRWIKEQIRAMRQQGLAERLKVLMWKLGI